VRLIWLFHSWLITSSVFACVLFIYDCIGVDRLKRQKYRSHFEQNQAQAQAQIPAPVFMQVPVHQAFGNAQQSGAVHLPPPQAGMQYVQVPVSSIPQGAHVIQQQMGRTELDATNSSPHSQILRPVEMAAGNQE
jgi:hypothetical protein